MGIISVVMPQVGQPDTTEDVKVINAFTTIQALVNGNIDSTNLSAGTSQSAGVNASGQTVKGSSIIATSQSTSSAAYTTLATPDQVTGIVLPTNGLIAVWYHATWQGTGASGKAAIFVGANQVKVETTVGGAPVAQETSTAPGAGASGVALLSSYGGGLVGDTTGGYTGDVTTGQIMGLAGATFGGAPMWIFATAGTYTISVQFKTSSGTVTASNRKLWVQALSFA